MTDPTTSCHKVKAKIYSGGEGTSHYYCPICRQPVNFDGTNPISSSTPPDEQKLREYKNARRL